jgi:hypothetical protein
MDAQRFDEIIRILGSDKVARLLEHIQPEQVIEMLDSVDLDALASGDLNLDFAEDHKLFTPYLTNSIFIRPFQLYGECGDLLKTRSEFQKATIYFIAKRKKLRLVLNETAFERDYLKVAISMRGEEPITYKIPLIQLFGGEQAPRLKQLLMFPVLSFFHFQALQVQYSSYPISGVLIDTSKSDENTLVFNIFTPSGQCIQELGVPHQLLRLAGVDVDDHSEILYIGQSRKMQERTISHEKIQRALAEAKDTEDIYVYFFSITAKSSVWGAEDSWKRLGFMFYVSSSDENFGDVVEITDEGRLNLVEMTLINYFRPMYNTTFVNSQIPLNKQVGELLKVNGYTRIITEVNFDSIFHRFGSSTVRPKQHHAIVYKLDA